MMRPPGDFTDGLRTLASSIPSGSNVIEVGCWAGESARIWIESGNIKSLILVDPLDPALCQDVISHPDVRGMTCNDAIASVVKLMEEYPQVHYIQTTSLDATRLLSYRKYDLIYIDGCHEGPSVAEDIRAWLPLVKEGGIIAGHDYSVTFPGLMTEVDKLFGKPDQVFRDTSWMVKLTSERKINK